MHLRCFKRWTRRNYAVFASLGRQVKIGVLCVSMSIVLHATSFADGVSADTLAVRRTVEIADVDVVGNRPVPTRGAVSQTSLFSRDNSAGAPVQNIESALRATPSVDIRERGGMAVQADISIRGGSFDQTMVMLNGIDFTDARTGHQSHSLPVDIESVAGIDLIDGVTGAGAYAGAVNIRTAPVGARYVRAEAAGGSKGYAAGNISGAVSSGRFSLFASGSFKRGDGYVVNTDFRNCNAFVRMNYDSDRAGFFDFQCGYRNSAFGSNGFYAAYNRDQFEKTQTALASLRWNKRSGAWTFSASASYRKCFDRYDWMRGTPMNRHKTDDFGLRASVERQWSLGTTSLGADYTCNGILSTNLGRLLDAPHGIYTHYDLRNTGNIWMRHTKYAGRFDMTLSAGAGITPYGTSALWSVAGGYRPVTGLRIGAGVSQSMRLPTFTDLYYTSPAHVNNLDLVPEKAVTLRAGLDGIFGPWSFSAIGYYRRGRDIIDWVMREEFGGKWHSEQVSRLNTFGAELSGAWTSEGTVQRLSLCYGYVSTSKLDRAVTSAVLDYMKHKASASLSLRLPLNLSLWLSASVCDRFGSYTHYVRGVDGEVLRDEGGEMLTELRDFKPYCLLDGRLSWSKGAVKIYLDVMNIADTDYFDFGGLELPGRRLMAGAVFTFGR